MPEPTSLTLFLAATAALLLTPGPAVLYIVARSLDQGRAAGLVSSLGIAVGTLFHVAAAAFGVSAILLASATAFHALKYVGAVYLVWLGIRKLREPDRPVREAAPEGARLRRVFAQGILVNVLNPKTALFFLSFLPQFVDPARGAVGQQVLLLGGLFIAMGMISDALWALAAGSAGGWLRGSLGYLRAQRLFAGGVYIALGLATAFSGSQRK